MPIIHTDQLSEALRSQAIRVDERKLLISRLEGSLQEADLSEPTNCRGYGRIRHFRVETPEPWPSNPLPIVPAASCLDTSREVVSNAQVFQNAACNWRCWYCFVPFNLLAASAEHSEWLTADELVAMYLDEPDRPIVIDCSGGQPDLVPEWIPWMMEALRQAGLYEQVYLWSDDNLSNDYFWRYLSHDQRRWLASYKNYGRVACFKGFDAESFSFNTRAAPNLFDRQFDLFAQLLATGMDLYAYATFTAESDGGLRQKMINFVDRLMSLHRLLPLRLVPLQIQNFGVVRQRVGESKNRALQIQEEAILAWNEEIESRFTEDERRLIISDVDVWS